MATTIIPARQLTRGNFIVFGEDDVREVVRAQPSRDDSRVWIKCRNSHKVVVFMADDPVAVTASDHEF
jgi:hypothetical protein